ncbi:MAG TPA: class I SAM-dependent methyltransferase [Kofleriaceae bacterium]
MSRVFRAESLLAIMRYVRSCGSAQSIEFTVLDPDRGRGEHAGELIDGFVHRPWRVWIDLAERMRLRMLTPQSIAPNLVGLRFEPLAQTKRSRERSYGPESAFARVRKSEDPSFVLDLAEALERVALPANARVLSLGVNTGDEVQLMIDLGVDATFVGVDRDAGALAVARRRFGSNVELIDADLADPIADPRRFDLVIAIGVLQSGALDDRALVRRIVQDNLAGDGSVIFGLPNCRYVDGETEYGARMVNFTQPELGLLVKDAAFYRKYLQQHHRQVFVTGKHYVFVTAVPNRQQSVAAEADSPGASE